MALEVVGLGPLLLLRDGDEPDASAFAEQHHEILVAVMAGDAGEARRPAGERTLSGAHHVS
ncbi:hypothetical protein [Streptomyces sp. NPDC057257]|uniref:hypothetical protein n=1 Tax=Streptomyces sp. NPDC057257 TaxID=3346071 RepID=UPI003634B5EC